MQVEFIGSYPDLSKRPEQDLPEFAFLGRSNCGKSSLINYLLQRKGMARISGQPGKTRLLNYFRVDERYYLVDLPGYGYAKVSRQQRERWWTLFKRYVESSDRALAVLHLVDGRHEPSAQDCEVSEWLRQSGRPYAIVVTKIDKVGSPQRRDHYRKIITGLDLSGNVGFLPTSARRRTGRDEVLGWMDEVLTSAGRDV